MAPDEGQVKGNMKPHLWQREISLLVQQALLYISGEEASIDALAKAKFYRKTSTFGEIFYLRQYGGRSFLDQIIVEFYPRNDLFDRRAALTMSVKGLVEHDVQTKMTETLRQQGFSPGNTLDTGFTVYSDGKTEIEVFAYVKDESASISIRKT